MAKYTYLLTEDTISLINQLAVVSFCVLVYSRRTHYSMLEKPVAQIIAGKPR